VVFHEVATLHEERMALADSDGRAQPAASAATVAISP